MEWATKSTDIITDLGAVLDDPQFVTAWKDLRNQTRTLLETWRRFVETDADVVGEVFDLRPAEAWIDKAVSGWRRHQRRLRDLSWYGCLIGSRSGAKSGAMPNPTGAPVRTRIGKPSNAASTSPSISSPIGRRSDRRWRS